MYPVSVSVSYLEITDSNLGSQTDHLRCAFFLQWTEGLGKGEVSSLLPRKYRNNITYFSNSLLTDYPIIRYYIQWATGQNISFQIVVVLVVKLGLWRWRQHTDTKRFYPATAVRCVTTHTTTFWTLTAMKTYRRCIYCVLNRASCELCLNHVRALEWLKYDSTCFWIALRRAGYLTCPWSSLIWSLYWWPEECASRSLFKLVPRELKWPRCSNGQTCICTEEKGVKRLVGWHKPLSRTYLSSR
jgi:hypothetical protein